MQSAQDPQDQTLQQTHQSVPPQQPEEPQSSPVSHQPQDDTSSVLDAVAASVIQQHDPLNPAGGHSSNQQELEKRAQSQSTQPQQETFFEPQPETTVETPASTTSEQPAQQEEQPAPVEVGAGSQATEIEFPHETESQLPPEVASYLEEIQQEEIDAPPSIVSTDDDGNVHVQTYDPTIMVLPITEKVVMKGLKKSPVASIRWLAEQCIKWMKKYAGKVAYKEDQV